MKALIARSLALLAVTSALLLPGVASAHVVVTPTRAGIGQELTFNVSVPNERATPVTAVKLLLPTGISDVTPTEKPGWTLQTTTDKGGELSTIEWSGSLPVGERDDFSFSAQLPATPTTLNWKAYQTYADGTVVHWDQTPVGTDDDATGTAGPYSRTIVVNDLSSAAVPTPASRSQVNLALGIAALALLLALAALLRQPTGKNRR